MMDEELEHICLEIGLGKTNTKRLIEGKILTAEDLCKNEEKLKEESIIGIKKKHAQSLLVAIEWLKKNPNANILQDFDTDTFDEMEEDRDRNTVIETNASRTDLGAGRIFHDIVLEEYMREVLGSPLFKEDEADKEINERHRLLHMHVDQTCLEEVIQKCKDRIMKSSYLKKACGKFEYDDFLDKAVRHFHYLVGSPEGSCQEQKIVLAGRTQSGKSSVKGVVQSLCGLLKIPLIVLTKGVGESKDLHAKLVKLSKDTLVKEDHIVVATNTKDCGGSKAKEIKIAAALENGGTLIIADTVHQVDRKACKAITNYRSEKPGGRFILIVDEADAMFRTEKRKQYFEQAMVRLEKMSPTMTVYISATPVSFMLGHLHRVGASRNKIDLMSLKQGDDYVGIDDAEPLKIGGKEVFLKQNELNLKSDYEGIPYTNKKAMALYDDALSIESKGVLLLDCSCPRVSATKNVFEKAEGVQNFYNRQNRKFIAIAVVGKGVYVKYPNQKWDTSWLKCLIGDVLGHIDGHEDYGLGMPVFIFGFSKMRRGVSFRSNDRVPTHMLMSLGRGHNMSTVIQTLGRATFNGKSVLKENGFRCVKILTTCSDFDTVTTVQNYIDEIAKRMKTGENFHDAMTGANDRFSDEANFFRCSFREIGPQRGLRRKIKEEIKFESLPEKLNARGERLKIQFWDDKEAQGMFRSLFRLGRGHNRLVHPDDLMDDMWDVENNKLNNRKLRDLLRQFCDNSFIEKDEDDVGWYNIQQRLDLYMNTEFGDIPDISNSDEESFDGDGLVEDDTSYVTQAGNIETNTSPQASLGTVEQDEGSVEEGSEEDDSGLLTILQVKGDAASYCPSYDSSFNDTSNSSKIEVQEIRIVSQESNSNAAESDNDSSYSSSESEFNHDNESSHSSSESELNYDDHSLYAGSGSEPIHADDSCTNLARKYSDSNTAAVGYVRKTSLTNCKTRNSRQNDCREKNTSTDNTFAIFSPTGVAEVQEDESFESSNRNANVGKKRPSRNCKKIAKVSRPRVKSPILLSLKETTFRSPQATKRQATTEPILRKKSKVVTLTNIKDIPLVYEDEISAAGKYIVEADMGRRIYYAAEDETPKEIADLFGIDIQQVLSDNKRRIDFEDMEESSCLLPNSPIVLPLQYFKEKQNKIEQNKNKTSSSENKC